MGRHGGIRCSSGLAVLYYIVNVGFSLWQCMGLLNHCTLNARTFAVKMKNFMGFGLVSLNPW